MRRFPAPVMPILVLLALVFLGTSGLTQMIQPPELVSPAPGATVTALAFEWVPVSEAEKYDIKVLRMQAGIPLEPPVWQATTHFTTITPRDAGAIPQGEVSWQVRAVDSAGHQSGWNQSAFTYELHKPVLTAPADDATLTAEHPLQFEWASTAGALSYQIDVAPDMSFTDVVWSATTADTSIIPPLPFGVGDLYWRVRGRSPGDAGGPFSATRRFTRAIEPPQNLNGPEGATPTFTWDRLAGARSYNVQVSATSDFSGTPLWEADTVNHTITPTDLNFGTSTRYWRVRARDAGGFVGDWAGGESFSLDSPGGVETLALISPEDGAVLEEDPAFRWQAVEGADSYVLEVSTSPSFDTLYDSVETNYSAYTPFSNLIQAEDQQRATYGNGTYYWRIRAVGADVVSGERQFTKAAPINLLEPIDVVVSVDPTFRWTAMAGAHHSRLVVSNSTTFDPVLDTVMVGNTDYVPYSTATDEHDTYVNGTHYWKIEALDRDNAPLGASDVSSFAKSSALNLLTPADGAARPTTPTFSWSPVAGAYRYRLTVHTGPASSADSAPHTLTVYDQIVTDATQYTPYAGEDALGRSAYDDGVYHWQVEALDNLSRPIVVSGSRSLVVGDVTVTPPASATSTLTPSPSATSTRSPTPTWTSSPTLPPVSTMTPSLTPTVTPSATTTLPPMATFTRTPTRTRTLTPTTTPTATASLTPSATASPSATQGPTVTPPPTDTPGPSPTAGFIPPSPTPRPGGRTDTDEPNDIWPLAAAIGSGAHESYISHERDLDWFKVYVGNPRAVLRVTLSSLQGDYDLALSSNPAGANGSLASIPALANLEDVDQHGQLSDAEDLEDIGALQDTRAVRDISLHRGFRSEMVTANTRYQPGWYFILVMGHNGEHDERPYVLNIEIDPLEDVRQCVAEPPHSPGVIIARWTASETPETLILINKRRMDAYYGAQPGPAEQLLAQVRALADHPSVNGVIEPVENNSDIAAAYDDWDNDACNPAAANRVTTAIKNHIDELREVYPTIQQVLIIGNDDIVPFHRVPDEVNVANESEYLSQVDADPDSPFYSSLEQGYILTDDFYVDDVPLAWRGRKLFVPDRPVGRLVETPNEIIDAIDAFLEMDGALSVQEGLVVGYDLLADSSNHIADLLRDADIDVESMTALGWTSSDLRDGLLNRHHDVNVINARFSHNRAAAPEDAGSPLTAEVVAEVGSLLQQSLFFSTGSHAGLSVPDRWASAKDRLDFSQAFNGRGVSAVANTGYGYGIAQADDYAERLMTYFTEELIQTSDATVGTALVRAKQRFLREAAPASFGPYHEKTMIEASLFGIPSLGLIVPKLAVPADDAKEVFPGPIQAAGERLWKRGIRLVPTYKRMDTPLGSYFVADDGVVSRPGRPIQPRFTWGVREPEIMAHGAVLTDAEYTDVADFDPLITRPLTDTTRSEPDFPFSAWSPARMHTINRLSTDDGISEQLVIVPGQFKNARPFSAGPAYGLERLYEAVTYDLYYSTSPDWTQPTIWRVRYEKRFEDRAEVWVDVTDPNGIERVVLAYTTGDGEWDVKDLQLVDGFSWMALLTGFSPDTLDYVIQAVDRAGNVAVSVDKGRLFGRRAQSMYLVPVMR